MEIKPVNVTAMKKKENKYFVISLKIIARKPQGLPQVCSLVISYYFSQKMLTNLLLNYSRGLLFQS